MTDKTRSYDLGNGTLVTLIIAGEVGERPLQVDIAIASRELDPEDPRHPGDIIWHDADADRDAFIGGLEAAARSLREATLPGD